MKNLALAAALSLVVLSSLPAKAEPDPLPNTGTYFITNMQSDEALQPGASSLGQSVHAVEYSKSGMQKWAIDRKIDPKTQKPTNRYTIKLAGENGELNFEPHPVADMSAVLGMTKQVYVLESGDAGTLIKSVFKNGDALYIAPQPPHGYGSEIWTERRLSEIPLENSLWLTKQHKELVLAIWQFYCLKPSGTP